MEKIYSKVKPEILLHLVVRQSDFKPGRQDLIDVEQFLQCSMLNINEKKTFKSHRHIWKAGELKTIAQESWIVIKGKVKCIFFDLNNSIIAEVILEAGDASFTLEGGHNYICLEDDTRVYEMKTGPYKGQILDKIFI